MISEVYDALREAGASEDKARAAATAIAAYESRFNALERDLTVLKWMGGTNAAMTLAILFRVFA